MFKEDEHPRDNDGNFTESGGNKNGYDSRDDLGNVRNAIEQKSFGELLGQEFKGFKGQSAIDKLMLEKKGHIKGAFYRDDIGNIDLLWGNDAIGLQHIIKQREAQGINILEFVGDLANVIENGRFRKTNSRGNFEIMYNGKIAVVAPEFKGDKITFLLTAFKTHSKK